MKICFVTSQFGSSENIGFMPVMATKLSRRGYDVHGIQYEPEINIDAFPITHVPARTFRTPYWVGQWRLYKDWRPKIRNTLSTYDADIVVSDRRCMAPTILAANDISVPVVGVVPGLGFTRFNPWKLNRDKQPRFVDLPKSAKIQYPFVRSLFHTHELAIAAADALVTLSTFLREAIKETFAHDSTVIRTPVNLAEVRSNSHDPEYLTMVNPRTELKGAEIALDIARNLPQRDFLIVGNFADDSIEAKATELSNVNYLGWVTDMRDVYAQTKVLLVPSLVEEGGPRVIGEAFANGIPAVGTTRGGIPEFIGSAGRTVSQPFNIDQWIQAIELIESNYQDYCNRASIQAKIFDIETQADAFEAVLSAVV